MVEQVVTCSWVPKSPGHQAHARQQATTFTPRFNSSTTRVTGLHPKKFKQASKLYPAGTVTNWLVYARAACSPIRGFLTWFFGLFWTWGKILHTFACFHNRTSCARSAHIQIQSGQQMTACNKNIFPCKGTFSAITLERLVRSGHNFQRICSYSCSFNWRSTQYEFTNSIFQRIFG